MGNARAWVSAVAGASLVAAACVGDAPEFPLEDAGTDASDGATRDALAESGADAFADSGADARSNTDAGAEANADAGVGADAEADARTDANADAAAGPCDPAAPFLHIENVAELNTDKDDESIRLTADERTAYFTSRTGGTGTSDGPFAVRKATRPARDATFDSITVLPLGIDSSGPSVTGDGTLLYYANSVDSGPPDLRVTSIPFGPASSRLLTAINSPQWEFSPYVRPDNLELYFASTRTANDDIFVSALANGDFAGVTAIDAVNTDKSERSPVISADGLTLYFGSNRGGDYEIYVVRRLALTAAFAGTPARVTELGAADSLELPDWLSPDACTLYFRSDRLGGLGGRDIYRASRR